MDLDKFRKAKVDKDALITAQKEKEREIKAKQEAIIKKYVDMLTEPILEKRIAAITDEELDDILAEDIFSNDIDSDTFNLPIKIYENFIKIKTELTHEEDDEDGEIIQVCDYVHSRYGTCHICNHKLFTIQLNNSAINIRRGKDVIALLRDEHYDDIKELGDYRFFYDLSAALEQTELKKLKTEGLPPEEARLDEENEYCEYYVGLNETRVTETLTKRLQEYGLIILDTQIEFEPNECNLDIIYKIKNPLK